MLLSAELAVRLIPNTAPIALVQSLAIRAFQQRHAALWEKLQPPMTDAAVNAINAIPLPVMKRVHAKPVVRFRQTSERQLSQVVRKLTDAIAAKAENIIIGANFSCSSPVTLSNCQNLVGSGFFDGSANKTLTFSVGTGSGIKNPVFRLYCQPGFKSIFKTHLRKSRGYSADFFKQQTDAERYKYQLQPVFRQL